MEAEEDEPRLKYQRFAAGSSVPEILKDDAASCFCVSPKLLAMGTHNGNVHLLDFNGNEIKRFQAHSMTCNELCFDSRGEYVGSCSDDGTVVVSALYSEETCTYEYHRPIKTCALDPDYAVKKSRQFVTGGLAGSLILNSKGWLGNRDHVLHSGEGTIHAVEWCGSLIAWANDIGVKIYDCAAHQRITYIDRPKGSPRPDLFKPHLHWANESLLFIGWADCVKIARVSSRSPGSSSSSMINTDVSTTSALPLGTAGSSEAGAPVAVKFVEIVALFQTDCYISGLAPFGDAIVIMAYVTEDDDTLGSKPRADKPGSNRRDGSTSDGAGAMRPEVRLVTWANEEVSTDVLSMYGYEHYKANDYMLAFSHPERVKVGPNSSSISTTDSGWWWPQGEEPLYYLVSPTDIVVGRPRDAEDRISWLLERSRFEEALATADSNPTLTRKQVYDEVGRCYLEHLLDAGEFSRAGALCPRLLKDATAWERWVFHFAQVHQLPVLAPYIPTKDPQLRDKVYEVVLNAFLPSKADHPRLLETVRSWPTNLYSIPTVVTAVQRRLAGASPADSMLLKEVLAELYMADGQRERALGIYLELQRPGLFDFIDQHKLYSAVQDKVLLLLQLDADLAIELLVTQRALIPPSTVVSQLQASSGTNRDHRKLLHRYLHALFERDPTDGGHFHALQVELYAEFDPSELMSFLTSSQFYPLEQAYDVCAAAGLVREMVFILGRMGSIRQALTLIMSKLGDIEQAIEFVQGQQDDDLWDELINHSLDSPDLVGALLERIGLYIDPLNLLRRLPCGMPIPNLRDRLVRIVADYRTQTSLRHGCNNILRADCAALAARLHLQARKAIRFEDPPEGTSTQGGAQEGSQRCCLCLDPLNSQQAANVLFFCSHGYHLRCLSASTAPPGQGGGGQQFTGERRVRAAGSEKETSFLRCVLCTSATSSKGGADASEGGWDGGRNRRTGTILGSVESAEDRQLRDRKK